MQFDHQYWKLVRYYWNPETQEIYIGNTDGTDSLPGRTYISDEDGSLIGGDDAIVGTIDDLTPDIINDSFWNHIDAASDRAYISSGDTLPGYEINNIQYSGSNLLDIFSSNPSTVNMTHTGRGINESRQLQ